MKSYAIRDIVPKRQQSTDYYMGIFEETSDPDLEWPHRHNFYTLIWFTDGSGINVIDFEEYEIIPNRLFAINPKQIHNWNYSKDCKGYFLLIEEHLANHLQLELTFPYLDIQDDDVAFIHEIFKRMVGSYNQEIAIKYIIYLLSNLAGKAIGTDSRLVTEYKRLVAEDYRVNSTVDQYALKINVSSEVLNELCRKETGLTAKQLQLDIKLTEAKRLLLYTDLNISEIAYAIGFEDSSYFSRIFRKKAGLTPNLFQRKYLNNLEKS